MAESLAGFRSKLRIRAEVLDIAVRQQILRLLVKEVRWGATRLRCAIRSRFHNRGQGQTDRRPHLPASPSIYGSGTGESIRPRATWSLSGMPMISSRDSKIAPTRSAFLPSGKSACRSSGLELHPDKTRLIEFGRHASENRERQGEEKPETFDFLGFTHMCGKTRKTGQFIVKRKTIRKRLSAKLKELKEELRRRWHEPVAEVGKWLKSVVRGYFNYHAVPGNMYSLNSFRAQVIWRWYRALRRRSQRDRMTRDRFWPLVDQWIPSARITHPHPNVRFDAIHPR